MKKVSEFYQKNKGVITKLLFPMFLLLYPFITVNQGMDVSDTLYSLTNFLFFREMEGMWMISTYLSNVTGWILTCLPFGTTVLGLKIYTSLFIAVCALAAYKYLMKWMPAWIVFWGEMIALSYCWIPSTILYNYLTYLLFLLGTLYLYKGLVEEKTKYLLLAGFLLGVNVFVRIPNLTQMALIIGLWYYMIRKRKTIQEIFQKTLCCIMGYVVGLVLPLSAVFLQYGPAEIAAMIQGLSAIQQEDQSYSVLQMALSTVTAYVRSGKWAVLFCLVIAFGTCMFFCFQGKWQKIKYPVYGAAIALLLRFLWGRGMFSFRYYEDYTSIYEWGMMSLFLVWIAAFFLLFSSKSSEEERLWAVLAMLITAITPLGSNNYTSQNFNNMFFTAPFTLYTFVKLFRRKAMKKRWSTLSFPWKGMVFVLCFMVTVQGLGFHSQFVFRDGMDGQKRDYVLHSPSSMAGMRTTKENGRSLEETLNFLETLPADRKVLLYGDCPGISFLAGRAPAIHTSWPDLDSEGYEKVKKAIHDMTEQPIVVIRKKEYNEEDRKKKLIEEYLEDKKYSAVFENSSYFIYDSRPDEKVGRK